MEADDLQCSRNARPQKGGIGSRQTILLARRTRTMKRCSSDARSEGQSGDSLGREGVMVPTRKQEALAWANGTSRRANGWAGEKAARSGRSISPHPRRDNQRAGRIMYKDEGRPMRAGGAPPFLLQL